MLPRNFLAAAAAIPLIASTFALSATAANAQPTTSVQAATANVDVTASRAAAAPKAGKRVPAGVLLAKLPTRPEQGAWTYDREKFDHWTTLRGHCDTRTRVLRAETVKKMPGGCSKAGGKWFNEYTGKYVNTASRVDIDHRVALAEAWRSGANKWTADRRRGFANDLGYAHSLLAVGDRVNASKSDKDPSDWLPSVGKCKYVARWVAVKYRWNLSVDRTEKAAISAQLSNCTRTQKLVMVPTKGKGQAKATHSSGGGGSTSGGGSTGGGGSAAPIGWNCPAGYPIKGNASSMIYHMPGGRYYDSTNPEECFATEAAARAAGYRASRA